MNKFYLLAFVLAVSLGACKTASKAYDKGDYREAIELAVKRLQKDPADGETKALVKNAYTQAVNQHEDNIRMLSGNTSDTRYEQIYNEYNQLQSLYLLIRQYPSLSGIVKATDYSDYITTYRDKAAAVYYEKGKDEMDDKDKRSYQEAYTYFQKALRFKKNDSELKQLAEEAYDLAITKIVVLPIDNQYGGGGYGNYGGYNSGYSNSYQFRNLEEQIIRNLRFSSNNNFVKFYSEWDARSQNIDADEIMELRMGRMIIGQPYDQHQTREVSKDIVVKETVYKPDSVVKQYAKVKAQITTTRRTLVSEGDLYVTTRDRQGRILWNEVFRGEHRWQVEFATYRGDERALSESDKNSINRNYNNNTPREEEIMENILREIENDMQYRVRNYYARYN
jgi:tetratricopeptide (TPR) repeat protein